MDARQGAKEWLIAQTGVLDLLLDALLPHIDLTHHNTTTTNDNNAKTQHLSQSQDLIKQLGKPDSHDHVAELLNRAFDNHSLVEKLAQTIYQAASALVTHDGTTKSSAKLLRPARAPPLRRTAPAARKPAAPDAFSIVGSHTALVTTPTRSPARPPMQAKRLAPLSAEAVSRAGSPASLIVEPRPGGDVSPLRAEAPASPSPGASGRPKTMCPPPSSSGAGNHLSPPPAVPLLSISKEYDTVSSRSLPSPARTQLSPTPMSDADRRHLQSLYDIGAIEPDHPAARHLSYIQRQRSGARIGGAAPNLADLTMRGVASG